MSSYYGVQRSSEYLAHYGVKGMKWGVRKFASDKYATPSSKFNKLYGAKSKKRVSAIRAQHHYNSLDKSKANIMQKNIDTIHGAAIDARYGVPKDKIKKQLDTIFDRNKQIKNINSMQDRIIKTAHKNRYSVQLTPKERSARYSVGFSVIPMKGNKVKIRKPRKYFTKQDFKDALGAGLVGAAFGPYAGLSYTQTKQAQRIASEIPANNNRHGKRNRRS